ncbi:GFA family protein [archaeon]|nr:MAG: GFA family protein [archaeon]
MADNSASSLWYHGQCYCGGVHFEVDSSIKPVKALYCHCESCRRAHSAPLYQIVYTPVEAFRITKGEELLKAFSRSESNPIRYFCSDCGSRVKNFLPYKPQIGIGFFPALLDEEVQQHLPEVFKPTHHYRSVESVLPCLQDNLERL